MSPLVALPIIAFVAALLFTPLTSRLAHLRGWVDVPGLRKIHSVPVAYLGGAAVMGGLMVALGAGLLFPSAAELLISGDHRLFAIILGTLLMFGMGLLDDVQDLRATAKLGTQVLATLLVIGSGAWIEGITLTEGVRIEFGVFGYLITLLWIVGVTNAVNIIDGMDGLASGLSVVASAAIAWTAFATGHHAAAVVAMTLSGAILGFIPYNLYPARVFLGDAGSLSIGFLLASMSVLTGSGAPTLLGFGVPLVALGIPILDTVFAMTRRLIERRSVMSPDKNHLHHRLLAMGYGQPATVLALCSIAGAACLVATIGATVTGWLGVAAIAASLLSYAVVFHLAGAVRVRESLSAMARVANAVKSATEDQQAIDHLQLRFQEVEDIHQWWSVLGETAGMLSFSRLELRLEGRGGTATELEWAADSSTVEGENPSRVPVTFDLPIPDRRDQGHVSLLVSSASGVPLDTFTRRLGAFGRLISVAGLRSLPCNEDSSWSSSQRNSRVLDVRSSVGSRQELVDPRLAALNHLEGAGSDTSESEAGNRSWR